MAPLTAVITRSLTGGAGGYAKRLIDAWPEPVAVIGMDQAPGLRFALRHRDLCSRFERVLSLERTIEHHVVRAGGGLQADSARAVGDRPSPKCRWLEDQGFAAAHIVVANSERVAARIRTRHSGRIEVVRTGVDLQRFSPCWTGDQGRILFAAHGWRRKGFDRAVRGLPDGYQLLVAGRDGRRRRWMRWARGMIGDRLVDLGTHADLPQVLSRVDAVLHPTRYDPASNLVLECMAAGVPVVTTESDGSAEILPPQLVGDPAVCIQAALRGGASLSRDLRTRAEQWPDSRNALQLYALLGETG